MIYFVFFWNIEQQMLILKPRCSTRNIIELSERPKLVGVAIEIRFRSTQ